MSDTVPKYFLRECGTWKTVSSHDNIVELLGIAEGYDNSGLPVLVSELYPLGNLRHFVEDNTSVSTNMRLKLVSDKCTSSVFVRLLPWD